MKTFAQFEIIGRVGRLKEVGSTLRVAIAADYGRKDEGGTFRPNPYWNEVTIFGERIAARVREHTETGDIVRAFGTVRQTQWETETGGAAYGVTLAAEQFDNYSRDERRRLAAKREAEA